jgi:GNAT superfamily N-acetyltransferase
LAGQSEDPLRKTGEIRNVAAASSDKYLVAMSYELVEVTTDSDWREYHSVRRRALFERRGLTNYDETNADEYNAANHPLLLKLDGRTIGTVRLDDFGNGAGAVRLVAIEPDLQRQGHGRVLSDYVESYARRLGITILDVTQFWKLSAITKSLAGSRMFGMKLNLSESPQTAAK